LNAFGKIIEILVTTILIFFIPLYFMACKNECIEQCYIQNEAIYFIDSIRNTGCLTRQMYDTFEGKIKVMKREYNIEFSYFEKRQNSGISNISYVLHRKEEILEKLSLNDGKISWRQGDYVNIKIQGKADQIKTVLFRFFMKRNMDLSGIYVTYGGTIRDDIF